jgi:hypothetical protein
VTDKPKLTPANENPWYVLMTLHGEHDGGEVDPAKHRGNLTAWNELEYAPRRTNDSDWLDFGKHWRLERKNWSKLQQEFAIRSEGAEAKLPANGQPVVLSQLRFEKPLVLTDYAFRAHVTLEDCVFEGQVTLDNCYFDAGVTFKDVQFRKGLSFKKSGCRTAFEATDITTQDDMTFAGSRFGGASTWKSLTFEPKSGDTSKRQISFLGARFDDYADFAEVTFDCYTVFQDTTFAQRAMFSRSRFKRGVSFRSAVFRDYAYFNDAQFTAAPNTKTRCHIP